MGFGQAYDIRLVLRDARQNFWATRRPGRSPFNIPVDDSQRHCGRLGTVGQHLGNLTRVLVSKLPNLRNGAGRQRAGQGQDLHGRHSQRRGAGVSCPGEALGDDADGRDAAGFGNYCVVETPRCAAPSIRNAVHHRIALGHQLVDGIVRARRAEAELAQVHHLFNSVLFFKDHL